MKKRNICILIIIFTWLFVIHYYILTRPRDVNFNVEQNTSDKILQKLKNEPFPTLHIVIPTTPRNGTNYLIQTFQNLQENFAKLKIPFKVNAFGIAEAKPELMSNNFQFTPIKRFKVHNGPELNSSRDHKIFNQVIDTLSIFKHFRKYCSEKGIDVFLFMEDDFLLCKKSVSHLSMIYYWSLKYMDDWLAIRTTIGFSGLFLQCRDIPEMIRYVEIRCLYNRRKWIFPHDTALGDWWTYLYPSRHKRRLITYRYNLMEHVGKVSSVGNLMDRDYTKCWEIMNHHFVYHPEQFDVWKCGNKMISPCNKLLDDFYDFTGLEKNHVPFKESFTNLFLKSLNITVKLSKFGHDCESTCKSINRRCESEAFPFINSCEYMKSYMTKYQKWKCNSHLEHKYHHRPSYDYSSKTIRLKMNPNTFSCKGSKDSDKRLCPCI